jgi:hypothetical protein
MKMMSEQNENINKKSIKRSLTKILELKRIIERKNSLEEFNIKFE